MVICLGLTVECDQYKCVTLLFVQLGKSALSRKKFDGMSFIYFQGTCIGIELDFPYPCGKTVALVGWFHTLSMSMFYILLRHFALHEKQKIIYQIATFTARLNSHKPLVYCTFYELWMQLMSCVCDLNLVDLISSFFTGNW